MRLRHPEKIAGGGWTQSYTASKFTENLAGSNMAEMVANNAG